MYTLGFDIKENIKKILHDTPLRLQDPLEMKEYDIYLMAMVLYAYANPKRNMTFLFESHYEKIVEDSRLQPMYTKWSDYIARGVSLKKFDLAIYLHDSPRSNVYHAVYILFDRKVAFHSAVDGDHNILVFLKHLLIQHKYKCQ